MARCQKSRRPAVAGSYPADGDVFARRAGARLFRPSSVTVVWRLFAADDHATEPRPANAVAVRCDAKRLKTHARFFSRATVQPRVWAGIFRANDMVNDYSLSMTPAPHILNDSGIRTHKSESTWGTIWRKTPICCRKIVGVLRSLASFLSNFVHLNLHCDVSHVFCKVNHHQATVTALHLVDLCVLRLSLHEMLKYDMRNLWNRFKIDVKRQGRDASQTSDTIQAIRIDGVLKSPTGPRLACRPWGPGVFHY